MNTLFYQDIPFPNANLKIYKEMYFFETWIRRILYASLLSCYGKEWWGKIPPAVCNELKQRRNTSNAPSRALIECSNNTNLIWFSTLDQVKELILIDEISEVVRDFTDMTKEDFKAKFNILKDIRNTISHNRSTTEETLVITKRLVKNFSIGVNRFRNKFFYSESADGIFKKGPICDYFFERGGLLQGQQFFQELENFYEITILPEPRSANYLNLKQVLYEYKEFDYLILAFSVSLSGDEYSIIWSKKESDDIHRKLIDKFINSKSEIVWTDVIYSKQQPECLCDPKIWFYHANPHQKPQSKKIYQDSPNVFPFPPKK